MRTLLFFAFLVLIPLSTIASHFVGGRVSFEHLSGCNYRVYVYSYYDCAGGATPIPIANNPYDAPPPPDGNSFIIETTSSSSSCSDPTPLDGWKFGSYEEVTQLCPSLGSICNGWPALYGGVAEALYYRDYTFCNSCTGVTMSFDNCCRSYTINSGASGDGIFIQSWFNPGSGTITNNAPVFSQPRQIYMCAGMTTVWNQNVYDPDGDSLVFSLGNCFDSPGNPVVYNTGFSPTDPLGPGWDVQIDSITGAITFAPDSTGPIINGVMCLVVEEYRNGIKISEIRQDLEVFTIDNCTPNPSAPQQDTVLSQQGYWLGGNRWQVVPNDTFAFTYFASDADTSDLLAIVLEADTTAPELSVVDSTTGAAASWDMHAIPTPDEIGTHFYSFFLSDQVCPLVAYSGPDSIILEVIPSYLDAQITNSLCNDSTGMIQLDVLFGVPPYQFNWSNGANVEDLINIPSGQYWVDIIDSLGNELTDTFWVNDINLNLAFLVDTPSCDAGGKIIADVSGGATPYSYLWNNGFLVSIIQNAAPGGYALTVTDANNCLAHEAIILEEPDSCWVVISGLVFFDQNGNCVQDSNEWGLPNYWVDLSPGGAMLTDSNGQYSFIVDTGQYNLELAGLIAPNFFCPTNGTHTLSLDSYDDDSSQVNFALDLALSSDLSLSMNSLTPPVPGNTHFVYLDYHNNAGLTVPGTISFNYDTASHFLSSIPAPSTHDSINHLLYYSIDSITPGNFASIVVSLKIDTLATAGDSVIFSGLISSTFSDLYPQDNADTMSQQVVASFDPNDKQVSPAGVGPWGLVTRDDQPFTYTIRFQNTGNFTARYVTIRDTLSHFLIPFSCQTGPASHPYQLRLEEDSILIFTFNDIFLPDSATDLLGSNGFVSYKLYHQNLLPIGTSISNRASIYFDFNPPVHTQTVINTLYRFPNLTITTDSLCLDDSISALIEGGIPPYQYQWANSTQNAHQDSLFYTLPSQSGIYSLWINDAVGYQISDSQYIYVRPTANAEFSYQANGLEVVFSPVPEQGSQLLWDFGDGTTSTDSFPVHQFAGSGIYEVQLIVVNECGTDSLSQTLSIIATALEPTNSPSVSVIPNPFSNQTKIVLQNLPDQLYSMEVFDANARLVRTYPATTEGIFRFEATGLSQGLYFYHLVGLNDATSFYGKLIIQ